MYTRTTIHVCVRYAQFWGGLRPIVDFYGPMVINYNILEADLVLISAVDM